MSNEIKEKELVQDNQSINEQTTLNTDVKNSEKFKNELEIGEHKIEDEIKLAKKKLRMN